MLAHVERFPGALALAACAACAGLFLAGCDAGMLHVWKQGEESFDLTLGTLQQVGVYTHNGAIRFLPQTPGVTTAAVTARIRAGGRDEQDAQACLEAIEILTPQGGDDGDVQEIRWGWKGPHRPWWSAEVSFEIRVPESVAIRAQTHNGAVAARDVPGDAWLESHNGAIRVVRSATDHLTAHTHNGAVSVVSTAAKVDLRTHNGAIRAALLSTEQLEGQVTTHNGGVVVGLDPAVNAEVDGRCRHGSISSELPWAQQGEAERKRLRGRLGRGGSELEVSTHNGSIQLVPAKGLLDEILTDEDAAGRDD